MPALKYRSALAAAFAGLWIVSAAAAPPVLSTAGEAALRVFLRQTVASNAVPAVAVVIVNRDQQIFLDATGKRDVAKDLPLGPDAIFAIASMTKPITSLAVMMLYEEGKIGFEDPVTKYLPEYEGAGVLALFNDADASFRTRPPVRPITIRHMLTHTSGIGYSFADARLARIDDGKKKQVEIPLLHDPGDRFTYGPNTAVLGSIVEKVSGQPLDVFLKTRIFDPVGMKDTFYLVPPDKHDRVATQHVKGSAGFVERPNPAGSCRYSSTAGGLA
jgi:CubicO group peptidase (beta-lactamase class C family)